MPETPTLDPSETGAADGEAAVVPPFDARKFLDDARAQDREMRGVVVPGPYGRVDLVSGSAERLCDDEAGQIASTSRKAKSVSQRLQAAVSGNAAVVDEVINGMLRAHLVIDHRAIGEHDATQLKKLLSGKGDIDMRAANVVGCVVTWYMDHQKKGEVYRLGQILADLVTVLPVEVAAKLLKGVANPDVTDQIEKGEAGLLSVRGKDLLPYAVEIFALISPEKRKELMSSMVQLGYAEEARALWRRVAANVNQRQSPYNAVIKIYLSMPESKAAEKATELFADMKNWSSYTPEKTKK